MDDKQTLKDRVASLERELAAAQAAIQARISLLESEQDSQIPTRNPDRFKMLFDCSRDSILFINRSDGSILEANSAAEQAYGYRREELLALTIHDLRAPGTREQTAAQMEQADAEGILFETIHQRKDRSRFPVEVSSQRAVSGGRHVLISIIRDITNRKRVEEERDRLLAQVQQEQIEAQRRGQELNAIIEALHEPVLVYDLDGRIVQANPAAIRAHGFDPSHQHRDQTNRRITVRYPNGELARTEDLPSARALRGEIVTSERFTVENAQGQELTVVVSSVPLRVGGRQKGAVSVWHDITEIDQAEKALISSEERFRHLADSMPQLVWTARPDGMVDYYNRRYREFNGITPADDQNWQWLPALHPDDVQRTEAAWARAVQTGEVYEIEHRVRITGGSYRWYLSRGVPVHDSSGAITRWYGTATDIHDQKLAEQALQERSQRLALLSDAASELLRSSEPAHILDHLYPRLASLLELDIYLYYRLSEDGTYLQLASLGGISDAHRTYLERLTLGQGISGSVAITSQPRVVEEVQQTQDEATGIIRSIGLRAYASFPLVIHNRLFGTISFGSRRRSRFDPETLDLARAICDLIATAVYRRQDEIRLQQFAEQLENSNRDLQEFAFVASHDLQEPLRKIEAFGAALVETSTNLSEKQVIFIERMRNAASRMRGMVNDLLMLSRVDRSAAPFSHIDLTQVASDALSTLEIQVRRTGAAIKVDELPKVEADASQMHQLLQNLIGNALKFHRKETPPQVKIYSRLKAPAAVQIFVEDNGIGFPQSEAERIFQPFQRLVGRSDYEGSGMGLSICRKIVERHNGSITAHSQPGQGSTFIITLPFRQGNIPPGRTE